MTDTSRAFGAQLTQLRTNAQISQEQLADRTSLHPILIAHIEAGERAPGLETIVTLARALDVSPGELVDAAARGAK